MRTLSSLVLTNRNHVSEPELAERLHTACSQLPLKKLIFGSFHDKESIETCRRIARKYFIECAGYIPLLVDENVFFTQNEWFVTFLSQERARRKTAAGTPAFFCPNNESLRNAVLQHISNIIHQHEFEEVVLDFMRFPSPFRRPEKHLACFCESCIKWAATDGFDLHGTKHQIRKLFSTSKGVERYLTLLLDKDTSVADDPSCHALDEFLQFRSRSITRFQKYIADYLSSQNCTIGTLCKSHSLCYAYGQDLRGIQYFADWLGIMIVQGTDEREGIFPDLTGLTHWLTNDLGHSEADAISIIKRAGGLSLPHSLKLLGKQSEWIRVLKQEIEKLVNADTGTNVAVFRIPKNNGKYLTSYLKNGLSLLSESGIRRLLLGNDFLTLSPEHLKIIREFWVKD